MRTGSAALWSALCFVLAGCAGGSGVTPAANASLGPGAGSQIDTVAAPALPNGPSGAAGYSALVLQANPIAYYPLADAGAALADAGGHSLGGAYGANVKHGGAVLTSAGNASAIFPGSATGSDVPSNAATVSANPHFATATRAVSIEAWIETVDFNRTNSFQPIVSYGRDIQGEPWIIELTPQSTVQFYFKTMSAAGHYLLKPAAAKISPGLIYHVVATYDGATAKLYVNGNLDGSLAASGAIDYSGVHPQYGLGIGGALGGSRPTFNGAIGNVSLYPAALSAADVENHFVTGQRPSFTAEGARMSDAFVDSIGVNTHISGSKLRYNNPWPAFANLIESSGIRHIRDGLGAAPASYAQHLNELGGAGIHASLITSFGQSAPAIAAALALLKPSVEAVEGVNEPDGLGLPAASWVPQTRSAQQLLWSTVKGNAATANLTVVGPPVVWESDALALGDLSAFMDRGNIHDYFSAYNPGTAGWGPLDRYGVYGSIAFNIGFSRLNGGGKPIWATETGYRDVGANSVDDRTLARYIPRILLQNFLNGVGRTLLYDFYDDAVSTGAGSYGLVRDSNVPKPSYYAVKSLIQLLADPGPSFAPGTLNYVLSGNTSNVQHLLLQKRDGTYELILWVETPSYDPSAQTDLSVPAQAVNVQLASAPSTAAVTTIGDSGGAMTMPLRFADAAATIAVDDRVSVVTFK